MTNTPNNRQTLAIRGQLEDAADGIMPKDWYGNSYRSTSYDMASGEGFSTIYVHWNTAIARFVNGHCVYFNLAYYASTTSKFQGRIRAGMLPDDPAMPHIMAELKKPARERGELFIER